MAQGDRESELLFLASYFLTSLAPKLPLGLGFVLFSIHKNARARRWDGGTASTPFTLVLPYYSISASHILGSLSLIELCPTDGRCLYSSLATVSAFVHHQSREDLN